MKKGLKIFMVMMLVASFSFSANAQVKFGIKGGLNIAGVSAKDLNLDVFKNYTGFHAGVAVYMPIGLGFAFQPELLYNQTGAKVESTVLGTNLSAVITSGNIELPLALQWGIKLGPIRPFAQAVPYVGYSISDMYQIAGGEKHKIDSEDVKKLKYGVGLGVGLDIWKLQLSFRYKWGLNSYINETSKIGDVVTVLKETKPHSAEISLAIFF